MSVCGTDSELNTTVSLDNDTHVGKFNVKFVRVIDRL